MENPFFKNRNSIITFLVIVGILGSSIFLLLHFLLELTILEALTDSAITSIVFSVISLSLWYPTNFISLENRSIVSIIFSNTVIILVATSLWLSITFFVITGISQEYEVFFLQTIFFRGIIGFLLFIIIVILNYVIIYYTNFAKNIINESNLNSLVTEAELKSLKYQINPHFIFNALNSISSLTMSDPEKAQEMSINLSDFFRRTLAVKDINSIPLLEEIENINLYLKIEKVRFAERLKFNLELSEECNEILIPNMILQPLVENAIKHGVYESTETVSINLRCKIVDRNLEITITNNYDSTTTSNIGEGIGLSNINSRLKLIYNQSNLISISKSNNLFKVILLIPIKETSYAK
jgi:two-component sensor histidine kinase